MLHHRSPTHPKVLPILCRGTYLSFISDGSYNCPYQQRSLDSTSKDTWVQVKQDEALLRRNPTRTESTKIDLCPIQRPSTACSRSRESCIRLPVSHDASSSWIICACWPLRWAIRKRNSPQY